MTRLISILLVIGAIFVGYRLYVYWETVQERQAEEEKAAARVVHPESLPGIPYQLETSLQAAQKNGAAGLAKWLEAYGPQLQDPRLAWIQLDYCVMLTLDNPNEAKRIFNLVKDRTTTNSPVYPRVKQLEKSFE